jgi:hypothetical protein
VKVISLQQPKSSPQEIELPDSWEDLSDKEKIFTFSLMSELFAGTLTPEIARMKMLIEYSGYRPSWIQIIREALTKSDQREIINFNLLKLSEELTFAFTTEENQIIPNYTFKNNPITLIKIGKNKYSGRKFERDITVKTDITAREFADCFDLFSALQQQTSDIARNECVNQICAILYPKSNDYLKNSVSNHHRQMQAVNPSIKFGVILWFTGIVKFYTEHPVYSLLFHRNKTQTDPATKINLGMNEIILELKKEGYGNPYTMNLNDYFDAQIKYLKSSINKALAEGVKPEKLSSKSGIPLETINKLS